MRILDSGVDILLLALMCNSTSGVMYPHAHKDSSYRLPQYYETCFTFDKLHLLAIQIYAMFRAELLAASTSLHV